ncbi:MAG: RimK family alpha-L-glutamate ligase [Nitrosarchaeum sp.]|nr:RimK family alpha-L-glutamate ligase [Nitrosarchaeum sp.]
MNAAILSLGSASSERTAEAMRRHFKEVDEIDVRKVEISLGGKEAQVLYEGKPIKHYDCIYAKGSYRYSPLLRSITTLLQGKTYFPLTPESFTIAHDKLLTQLILQQHDIPMPATFLAATVAAARKILEKANYPLIMKFPQGTQGKGVLFADSLASAKSILDALSALKQPFLIQEYIETGTSDIRAFVIGDRVIAAMRRQGTADEARANLHAGGVGEPYVLSSYAQKIAVQTAQAIGAGICGVDILESVKGPLVIEANVSPGLGIEAVTKIDVADKIAQHLHKNTQERKQAQKQRETRTALREVDDSMQLLSPLDFRGTRVLLPEIIVKRAGLREKTDYEITALPHEIRIRRFHDEE